MTFYQINFTQRGLAQIWRPTDNKFLGHVCNKTFGLQIHHGHSVGFDIYGLVQLLALPRQLRQLNAYTSKLISLVKCDAIKTIPLSPKGSRLDGYDFDFAKVASANFGVELQWVPHTPSTWFGDYVKNVITFGLGFVPGIGFILSISFSLGWTALTDPDSFYDALKASIPAVLLTDGLISELKKDAAETKKLLPPGWDQVGKALQVPPTQVEGSLGTDEEGSTDGVGRSWTFEKAAKVVEKSKTVGTPAPED